MPKLKKEEFIWKLKSTAKYAITPNPCFSDCRCGSSFLPSKGGKENDMMKSLKNMLKQDKEKYTVPKSVHDYIPITAIWEDGIFKVGNKYAKTFRFTDINYLVVGKEDTSLVKSAIKIRCIQMEAFRNEVASVCYYGQPINEIRIVAHQLHNLQVEKFTKLCYNIYDSYTTIQIVAAR